MCMVCVCPSDEMTVNELRELQVKLDDFNKVKLIGKGAYGEVQLVRGLWVLFFASCRGTFW